MSPSHQHTEAAPAGGTSIAAGGPLLEVRGLRLRLTTERGVGDPVDGVSFDVRAGSVVGLVGESGCGKSLTALCIMRLHSDPPARIVAGAVRFAGQDLLALSEREMARLRGDRMAMIFQEPATSLNPVYSCGEQIAEVLRAHRGLPRRAANQRAIELLRAVGIGDAPRRARAYPHQLSGGTRQRVMIAMAIACDPALLIADEPTTALDVTVQAQVLDLIDGLRAARGMAVLHITHDLALIAHRAEDLLVMYAGRIVECGPTGELLARPAHPYTLGLLACRPQLGRSRTRLPTIAGSVPSLAQRALGCRFAPRCPFATGRCEQEDPDLLPAPGASGAHRVACWEAARVAAAGGWPSEPS